MTFGIIGIIAVIVIVVVLATRSQDRPFSDNRPDKIEGVTEDLKRSDAMEYTRRMNSIRNRVEEFVLHDFVYA